MSQQVVAPLLQLAGAHSGARQASMVSRVRELAHAHTYQVRVIVSFFFSQRVGVELLADTLLLLLYTKYIPYIYYVCK